MKIFHYLSLIKEGGEQASALLRTSSDAQIKKLQRIAHHVLSGKIPLTSKAKQKLKESARFIRRLGDVDGNINGCLLSKHVSTLQALAGVAIKHEVHEKNGFSSSRKMGKDHKSSKCRSKSSHSSPKREDSAFSSKRRKHKISGHNKRRQFIRAPSIEDLRDHCNIKQRQHEDEPDSEEEEGGESFASSQESTGSWSHGS